MKCFVRIREDEEGQPARKRSRREVVEDAEHHISIVMLPPFQLLMRGGEPLQGE
jgi:hypothetical protein